MDEDELATMSEPPLWPDEDPFRTAAALVADRPRELVGRTHMPQIACDAAALPDLMASANLLRQGLFRERPGGAALSESDRLAGLAADRAPVGREEASTAAGMSCPW